MPAIAENESTSAPVQLDGITLFSVSDSGRFTARERAEDANQILQQAIASADESEVKVDYTRTVPVIRVNNHHLLSVTAEDVPDGRDLTDQARRWEDAVERALQRAQYQRSPAYLRRAGLRAAGAIAIALFAAGLLGWLYHRLLAVVMARGSDTALATLSKRYFQGARLSARALLAILRGAIAMSALLYISTLLPQTRQLGQTITSNVLNALSFSLTSKLITLGESHYSLLDVLTLLALFAGMVLLVRTLRRLLRSRLLALTGLNRSAQATVALIVNYILLFIGTIVVLQLWGLNLSSLTVFASVLGVGISLGLQGVAKEFISGVVLIFERPIQVGDFVDVGGLVGTVERISVRSTEIRTLDQISIILPNSRFLESEVINWSHGNPTSRLQLPVGVSYNSSPELVRQALLDAARTHPDVLGHPEPTVFFKGFGESALNFDLLVWIAEPPKQFRIKSDLYFALERCLRDRQLEIPFPQRDLHLRSGALPLAASPELSQSLERLSEQFAAWLGQQNLPSTATNGRDRPSSPPES
ncbi:MAG: mechanosensitive ion channel [Spirulinaceae cyanobacterium RM2_2_10]|nr:mechanosensitive ion channel [Spirulinaceae cyanobacterium SM2_1_0]NJO20159.1 mechanosensitive ion channel [Spirulinaceae cyanobacterium RM2_2_10]